MNFHFCFPNIKKKKCFLQEFIHWINQSAFLRSVHWITSHITSLAYPFNNLIFNMTKPMEKTFINPFFHSPLHTSQLSVLIPDRVCPTVILDLSFFLDTIVLLLYIKTQVQYPCTFKTWLHLQLPSYLSLSNNIQLHLYLIQLRKSSNDLTSSLCSYLHWLSYPLCCILQQNVLTSASYLLLIPCIITRLSA